MYNLSYCARASAPIRMFVNRRLGSIVIEVYFGFRLSVVSARGSSSVAVHFLSSDWCRPSPRPTLCAKKHPKSLTIIVANLAVVKVRAS